MPTRPHAATEVLPRALRLLGSPSPTFDDLSQDVLLAAYESLDRFDPAYPTASPPRGEAARPCLV
ncbi:sigma factor [Sorangium sp. So ce119]|uniref:sigma factor n=1 Tax=Sorangium sp. So ce119 TaxID=3133279 RepID=UPI003F61E3B0